MLDCDVVVIGSGAGGLTAAAALARSGQTVRVYEQHSLPGGWMHTFGLGGYRFSPGVHYLGGMQPDGELRRIWEGLGLASDLTLLELNRASYDQVRVGGQRFDWAAGAEARAETLAAQLPGSAQGVRSFFCDMERIAATLADAQQVQDAGSALRLLSGAGPMARWGLRPLESLLHHHVSDPIARTVLAAQVGDTGLPPSRIPTLLHAAVLNHYVDGGVYPQGGGGSIPRALLRQIKAHGGSLKVRAPVQRILTENDPAGRRRAVGVRLADGTEVRSRHVVSNADPQVTFGQLLDPEDVSERLLKKLRRMTWSKTALSLFFAADLDPAAYGLDSGNLWWFAEPDVEGSYRVGTDTPLQDIERFPSFFLTVTSLKDRTKVRGSVHTLEAFVLLPFSPFAPWAGTQTGQRPPAYLALKKHLEEAMLNSLEGVIPDLRERLQFSELGTPLTNQFYCASTDGNLYGTEKGLTQLGPLGWNTRTEIGDLLLCGASTLAHGVAGATLTGLLAAGAVADCAPWSLLDPSQGALSVLPADDPLRWPASLQRSAERALRTQPPRPTYGGTHP